VQKYPRCPMLSAIHWRVRLNSFKQNLHLRLSTVYLPDFTPTADTDRFRFHSSKVRSFTVCGLWFSRPTSFRCGGAGRAVADLLLDSLVGTNLRPTSTEPCRSWQQRKNAGTVFMEIVAICLFSSAASPVSLVRVESTRLKELL